MPTVTALRPDGPARVLVELDGRPWRSLPLDVAAAAGLVGGMELGRPELRRLRRELRRAEALDLAARVLRRHDVSEATLRRRLAERGLPPRAREEAIAALTRAGLLDDGRFAFARARSLAERDAGDELIRADLAGREIGDELAGAALAQLAAETERAREIVGRRGESLQTARYLMRKGFSQDALEAALPSLVADEGAATLG